MTQNILDRTSLSLHCARIIFVVSALVISVGVSSVVAQDGVAGATSYAAAPTPTAVPYDTDYEDSLLSGTRQLITDSLRSGEGYFSADG